jgi:hypothetical protein
MLFGKLNFKTRNNNRFYKTYISLKFSGAVSTTELIGVGRVASDEIDGS